MWVPLLINGLLRNLIEETAGLGRGVGLDRGVRGYLAGLLDLKSFVLSAYDRGRNIYSNW